MSGQLQVRNKNKQVSPFSSNNSNGFTVAGNHCAFQIKNGEKRVAFAYQGPDDSPATAAAFYLAKRISE